MGRAVVTLRRVGAPSRPATAVVAVELGPGYRKGDDRRESTNVRAAALSSGGREARWIVDAITAFISGGRHDTTIATRASKVMTIAAAWPPRSALARAA